MQDLVYGPLKDYKQVIFHCHLSQQRGPKAAGQYAQARQAALESGKLKVEEGKQEVLVLRGGFSEFQDKYKVSRQSRNGGERKNRLLTLAILCNPATFVGRVERSGSGGEVRCISVGVQKLECRSNEHKAAHPHPNRPCAGQKHLCIASALYNPVRSCVLNTSH